MQRSEVGRGGARAAYDAALRFKRIRRYLLLINVAVVIAVLITIAMLVLH